MKAFLTDRAFEVCVAGQQVLGGHGYVREWGQEQKVRDARIAQIYEGTNGVQAMDFITRKTVASGGRLVEAYISEIREELNTHGEAAISKQAVDQFNRALNDLEDTTSFLVSAEDNELAGSAAVDYLDMVGYVSYAYMWLKQMATLGEGKGAFADSKKKTGAYYLAKFLPVTGYLAQRIRAGAELATAFSRAEF